jgi:predicted component of type VI protein secretion system
MYEPSEHEEAHQEAVGETVEILVDRLDPQFMATEATRLGLTVEELMLRVMTEVDLRLR